MSQNVLYQIFRKNLSLQLLAVVCFALIGGEYLNVKVKSGFYTISIVLEETLMFMMPGIIFGLLFSCLLSFKNRLLQLVSFLMIAICLSNFFSAILAYLFGILTLPLINLSVQSIEQTSIQLTPLWNLEIPLTIQSEYALIFALVLGIIFTIYPSTRVNGLAQQLKERVNIFMEKAVTPLMPIYIFGFVLKMQHEGMLGRIIQGYGQIFVLILILYLIYLIGLYCIAARFNLKQAYVYLRNVLPSGIMGFTTVSSIATMPVTLRAAEKNTKNPILSETVIPFTVNMHLVGDSLAIPILAMAILLSFGQPLPVLESYLIFGFYFMLCRLAVVAVPGGGIIILLPILESHLGFSAEMSVLITTLFVLFDPFATVVNVMSNGGFAILAHQFLKIRTEKTYNPESTS